MTKGLGFDFLGLYRAILKDISVYLPSDHRDLERDLLTLTRLARTRGQPVFTMDLPSLGKVLDRALADGRLLLSGLPLSRGRTNKTIVPRLFWGLWSRLFENDGCLKPNVDPNIVFFLRTLLYVGKNLEWECSPRYLYEATEEFFRIEAGLPIPGPFWGSSGSFDDIMHSVSQRSVSDVICREELFPSGNQALEPVLVAIQQSADRTAGILGTSSPEDFRFRHGPGAVSDLSSGEYKYDFPRWGSRLEEVFPWSEFGSTGLGLMDRLQRDGLDMAFNEPCSRLIAVPKTQKGPRLIAAEPTDHQWIQQGIRDFLYRRVASTPLGLSLDFSRQDLSQERTLRGSLDGSVATIDLKSASDRISCWLVERMFRRNPELLRQMMACRTRFIRNDIDVKHSAIHKLRKFSTQGSALTFPVQSLIFLNVCLGVGRFLHPHESWETLGSMVRVFGDDLIVPKSWEPLVSSSLEALFLKVNRTKTFSVGKFRESCGMDAWDGHDVTPPHVTMRYQESDPRTIASNVAVSNNFFKKGLWHSASWVTSTIREKLIPTVHRRSGIFGFVTHTSVDMNTSKSRWNHDLHHWESKCLGIFAKALRTKTETAGALLQYFTEEPDPYVKYESGVAVAGVPVKKHAWVPREYFSFE